MTIRLLVFAIGLSAIGCRSDPACNPGQQSARDRHCVVRALGACNDQSPESARERCFDNWKGICQSEADDYAERCTQ